MSKILKLIGITVSFVLILSPFAFSQTQTEQLTITTYYPSPYGVYRELRSMRMAIGDDYIKGGDYDWGDEINTNADLVVEGNVGIGTTAPGVTLDIVNAAQPGLHIGTDLTHGIYMQLVESVGHIYSNGFAYPFSINNGSLYISSGNGTGNVGIGTTGPSAQLHTTGTVRFANFGAGTATFDASGNISSSSDARLKDIQGKFSRGLSSILLLDPIIYKWNKKSGMETGHAYAGFSAQDMQKAIPEAVGENQQGYLTLSDRPIIAALVNAIKEQQKEIEGLKQEVAWLKEKP